MSRRLDAPDCVWFGDRLIEGGKIVSFTMPGVRFGFRVTGASRIDVKMDTGGNFFRIALSCVTHRSETVTYDLNMHPVSSEGKLEWIRVASNLEPSKTYDVKIFKKTEPELKSILSRFYPVRVKYVRAGPTGINYSSSFLPVSAKELFYPSGYIEVIGDSDACGFGVDGEISSTMNLFSMDGVDEDCFKAWGAVLARKLGFGDSFLCTAWSGKGIARNAPMCGETCIPELWYKHHQVLEEPPALVAILAGGNDFFDKNHPDKHEFVSKFSELMFMIRKLRGDSVPIYVFQCSPGCCSSGGSPSEHPMNDPWAMESARILDEFTREAVEVSGGLSGKIFYHRIEVQLDLPCDYATMMHWSVRGQEKVGNAMAQFISSVASTAG